MLTLDADSAVLQDVQVDSGVVVILSVVLKRISTGTNCGILK